MNEILAYPAAERCLYPFGLWINGKDTPSTVTQIRIGKHDFKSGDRVVLLANDMDSFVPLGAKFNDVSVLYYVTVVNTTTISLYTMSGTTKNTVVLNTSVQTDGAAPIMKYFSVFRVNPLKAKNQLTVDVFNYDAYYNRFLTGGRLIENMKRETSTSIMTKHGLKTGDRIQFTNIQSNFDVGQLKNHVEYYACVLDATRFQVMATINDAILGTNPLTIGVDVNRCTVTCINFWLTSTVSSVRKDAAWHYNFELMSVSDKLQTMHNQLGVDENTDGVEIVDHGFARPLIDKGSLRDKVRMHLQEHLAITVYQDDRAVADSSKVYDNKKVHMYNTYTNGANPYAFKIEKGHGITDYDVTILGDDDVRVLFKPFWYNELEMHVVGTLPVQGVVYIEGEYIEYMNSTTYLSTDGKTITKLMKLRRGSDYTHEGFLYKEGTKVLIAMTDNNSVNVALTRSKQINATLPRSEYSHSTPFIYMDVVNGETQFNPIKSSDEAVQQRLRSRKATYKGLN